MTTIRIFFEKCGEAAYISLLDLQRVFHRMLKMSSLPVYYTQGFNPHIYLSFTCPLSLGQESLCESCEVKTEQETIDPQTWIDALQPLMPRGIVITKIAPAVEKVGEIETAAYEVTMPASSAIALDAFKTCGIDPDFYNYRAIGLDEVTPWDHLDVGVTKAHLVREYKKALEARTTQPCNRQCSACGANKLIGGPCFDYNQDIL